MPAVVQPGTLEADPAATDLFRANCFDDGSGAPLSLVAQLTDTAPVVAPLVSVQIQKGFAARSTTDGVDGDGAQSPAVFVNGGAGIYDVFVDKTAAGAESYSLALGCMTAVDGGGVATGLTLEGSEVVGVVPALGATGAVLLGAALLAAALRLRSAALLGVVVLAAAGVARAHTQGDALGTDAAATDFFQVTCSDDGGGAPGSLLFQIAATSGAPDLRVSAQAQKGLLLTNTTDPANADGSGSPAVFVNGGAGVYDVLVDKSAAGTLAYTLTFHCQTGTNGSGGHTGTTIVTRQNQ